MARWKLTEAHYLNCPGGAWEQKETDRFTGKQVTKRYLVPTHLDPKSEADWNYGTGRMSPDPDTQEDGIIVCLEGRGKARDIAFVGDPTPGMLPLDDEARAISASFSDRWKAPGVADERTFSELKLDEVVALLGVKASDAKDPQMTDLSKQISELTAVMTEMAKLNASLMAQIASPARRV